MSDKDKDKQIQSKNIPKDGQVIMAIMKEMGISEYDPKCVVQLTEFVYKYATNILEEARMYANNNSKKRILEIDDVRLALQLSTESTFTTPPPREIILECANVKNYTPLPLIKPHCGLRLPPDRYCLSTCNYALKSSKKKSTSQSGIGIALKIPVHKTNVTYVKKTPMTVSKQTINIPKPLTKIANAPKTGIKPKIIISSPIAGSSAVTGVPSPSTSSHNVHSVSTISNGVVPMETENSLKRKREDDNLM